MVQEGHLQSGKEAEFAAVNQNKNNNNDKLINIFTQQY